MAKDLLEMHGIGIYKLIIPLKEPFVISLGAQHNAESVIVVMRAGDYTGYGECSPYKSINGESVDTCMVVGEYLAKALKHQNALDIKSCVHVMDKVIYGNTSIKSAFDMALYDIASQYYGQPLYRFLGGDNSKTIATDYTVSIGDPQKMADDAARYISEGFPVIKVKLGESRDRDVMRIQMIRKRIGLQIPLRIDANQGWDFKTAVQILNDLEPYNIQYCEEPIARWDFMRLRKLRKKSPIPVMADESCCSHHDAKRLVALKACDMFNIKLGKSGGIFEALKIVRIAEKAGMKLQVGGFTESKLGMTAFAHLALCSKNIQYYDFDTPLMFTEDPVTGGITYHENGVVKIPELPGLGATIDSARLHAMEKVMI